MRKEKFIPGEYYHIYSRILFNAPEFSNNKNANKLAQALILANSTKSNESFQYLKIIQKPLFSKAIEIAKSGEKLVDVLCYTIMPDHYHLLLKEKRESGVSKFIHKCNVSIAKYINLRNNRKGPLFENRFNAKHINTDAYLLHLSLYIHLNPLDFLIGREWREGKLKNWPLAKKKLLAYPWSSIKAFIQKGCNDHIISGIEIIKQQFGNPMDYENFLKEWSKKTSEEKEIADILMGY